MSETENPVMHHAVKTFSPFLVFACVGADFVAGGDVGVGVKVQYLLQGGNLPEERKLRGRTADNTNLTVLNNFNGRNLSEIK